MFGHNVRRNKTDRTDTEALLEAARCGGIQPAPVKTMLTATALVGAVNHIHAFRRGREFAIWLGLTPPRRAGAATWAGSVSVAMDTCAFDP